MTTLQKTGLAAVLAALTAKQPAADTISRENHMTAVNAAATEAYAAGETAGKAAALTDGATAERTRIKAIVGGDNAKGREGLAAHFAYDTDMSVEAANAALAASPKAEAGKPTGASSRLDVLMPGNTPQIKEPGASTASEADALGASLDGAVDALSKQRGLVAR